MRRRWPRTTLARKNTDWMLLDRPGRASIFLLLCGLIALILFRSFPGIDYWGSAFFYTALPCPGGACGGFSAEQSAFWQAIREIGLAVPRWIIIAVFVWLGWQLFGPARKQPANLAPALLATSSAFVGPLLIVNWILKELWGRPRPIQTVTFGGDGFYTAPGSISQQCESNCSFVSGEAAAAFWLVWLVVLVPQKWRRQTLAITITFAAFVSVLRMAFGRHYISDVTMSAFIATFTVTAIAWALQTAKGRKTIAQLAVWSNGLLARRRNQSV